MSARDPRDVVTLNVAGVNYTRWTSISISAGIEQAAREFSLALVAPFPGQLNPLRVQPGMPCAVLIGDDLVLSGWAETIEPKQDATTSEIGVGGRSRTCDLVDCSCLDAPRHFAGLKAEAIGAALAKPYGVDVVAEVDTGAVFGRKATIPKAVKRKPVNVADLARVVVHATRRDPTDGGPIDTSQINVINPSTIAAPVKIGPLQPVFSTDLLYLANPQVFPKVNTGAAVVGHTVEHGETVIESIQRLAEKRALLVTDDALGRLVLTRAGTGKATTAIVRGDNVISGSAKFDASKVYSEIAVRGQRAGTVTDFGDNVNALGTATDPAVLRFRRLALHSRGHSSATDCKKEAIWEAANRLAKSCTAEYTVRGWRQVDGTLWRPNLLVEVRDPVCALFGEMLITAVNYLLDDTGGTICKISVALAAGYEPKPIPKGGGRKQSLFWAEIAGGVSDRAGVAYHRDTRIGRSSPVAVEPDSSEEEPE